MRGLCEGSYLLDGLEEGVAKMCAKRVAEKLAEQPYILSQRLVRIAWRRQLRHVQGTAPP